MDEMGTHAKSITAFHSKMAHLSELRAALRLLPLINSTVSSLVLVPSVGDS